MQNSDLHSQPQQQKCSTALNTKEFYTKSYFEGQKAQMQQQAMK